MPEPSSQVLCTIYLLYVVLFLQADALSSCRIQFDASVLCITWRSLVVNAALQMLARYCSYSAD
jgi:hypothetical protein